MYEGNNPTALKSQEWIAETLLQLMQEKEYSRISIREISEKSNLSRQTFYNLFSSKEDVIRIYLRRKVSKVLREKNREENKWEKDPSLDQVGQDKESYLRFMVDSFVTVLRDNRAILTLMMNQGLEYIVSDEILYTVQVFAQHLSKENDPAVLEYSVSFLGGGLAQTMLCWMKQENPMEPKELTEFLHEALTGGIVRM